MRLWICVAGSAIATMRTQIRYEFPSSFRGTRRLNPHGITRRIVVVRAPGFGVKYVFMNALQDITLQDITLQDITLLSREV